MLDGNKCELCYGIVESPKAQYKQTKYCQQCAKQKKKENTIDSWLPERRKEYMRQYMREYRLLNLDSTSQNAQEHIEQKQKSPKNKNLTNDVSSTKITNNQNTMFFSFIGFLFLSIFLIAPSSDTMNVWFEWFDNVIKHFELIIVKITGLAVIISFCWQHIKGLRESENKNKKSEDDKSSVN